MKTILEQNLSEPVTSFDVEHGVEMVSPNSWRSEKHKLFGYSTARQLRNGIKRNLAAQAARRVAQLSPDAVSDRD